MEKRTGVPRAIALPYAEAAKAALAPHVARVEIAGSIRRQKLRVNDIEIVCEARCETDLLGEPTVPVLKGIEEAVREIGVRESGGQKLIKVCDVYGSGMALDLFIVTPPARWGVIYAIRTGSAPYMKRVMQSFLRRGLQCRHGRVVDQATGQEQPVNGERDFFRLAGLQYIPPEHRDR